MLKMNLDAARQALHRRAIVLEMGGFRPPDDPLASWFGRVSCAAPGEDWPTSGGEAMHALCQINLTEMPFRPTGLGDVELITVFIGPGELPTNAANGANWCLRAYSSLAQLVPLPAQDTGTRIKSLPLRPHIIEADYPVWEDVDINLDQTVAARYEEYFANASGFKLGGWPTLIQSAIHWAPGNNHPAAPKYVFQIDSTAKGNWLWGDHGVGYFGRGTSLGYENEWICTWQCH